MATGSTAADPADTPPVERLPDDVADAAGAEIVRGVVTGLEVAGGGRWEVTLGAGDTIAADGVVLTGAGPA